MRLGTWLRVVRDGTTLIVTDRGRPVAEIRPIVDDVDDVARRLAAMAVHGEVTLPTSRWQAPVGVPMSGPSIGSTVVEDREDRF